MRIYSGRALVVTYGIFLILTTQIVPVLSACAIEPDANGHVNIPLTWASIDSWAFLTCYALKSISIRPFVRSIGPKAFKGCTNLKSVTIPGAEGYLYGGVTYIAHEAFYGCSSLVSVTIPATVTHIDLGTFKSKSAFYGCSAITTLNLSTPLVSTEDNFVGKYFGSSKTTIKQLNIFDIIINIITFFRKLNKI